MIATAIAFTETITEYVLFILPRKIHIGTLQHYLAGYPISPIKGYVLFLLFIYFEKSIETKHDAMSRFILFIKGGKGVILNRLSSTERKTFFDNWVEWSSSLRKKGIWDSGALLVEEGKALFNSGGMQDVAEYYELSSEVIIGFCVVKAIDEEEMVKIADGCPFLKEELTICEIRKFRKIPNTGL